MKKYLVVLIWAASLTLSCTPKPSPNVPARALGHPRSEVLTNPEIKAADEQAHLFTAPSETAKPETQVLPETDGSSLKEVYGFAVKLVNGIKCFDAPFDLANPEENLAYFNHLYYLPALTQEQCSSQFEICTLATKVIRDENGNEQLLFTTKYSPLTCKTLQALSPKELECSPVVKMGVKIGRYIHRADCEADGSHCIQDTKGREYTGHPRYSRLGYSINCWRRNQEVPNQDTRICRDIYDESLNKILSAFSDIDSCLQSSSHGCDLIDTDGPVKAPSAKACFQSVEPRVQRPPGYVHPTKVGITEIKTGAGPEGISWKVDSLSCNDGTIQLSKKGSRKCADVAISPGFHTDLLPALQQCIKSLIPEAAISSSINLEHWGVYSNRDMRSGIALSSHAYAAALDLHAIQVGDLTLNFEKAKDAYVNAFETFLFQKVAESTALISEENYSSLLSSFEQSTEFTKLEVARFWIPVFDCLKPYGISSNAGRRPELVRASPSGPGYLRKVLRRKGDSKTVAHDNHVHID